MNNLLKKDAFKIVDVNPSMQFYVHTSKTCSNSHLFHVALNFSYYDMSTANDMHLQQPKIIHLAVF